MKRKRILYYEPSSGYGGSSRCLLSWLGKLDVSRYEPVVVAHNNGPSIRQMKAEGHTVIRVPLWTVYPGYSMGAVTYALMLIDAAVFVLPAALALVAVILLRRIDIVHLNTKVITGIPGIIAAKLTGRPCICHLHDTKAPIRREKAVARWVDCFMVLTDRARELYRHEFPGHRIETVYNGLDLRDFRQPADASRYRQEFGIAPDERVAGIVGRLVDGKGFQDFVKAAGILRQRGIRAKYVIIGSSVTGSERYEQCLRQRVASLGMEREIIFTGWREDARSIMGLFDVMIQASSTFPEGFGMTVVEAMALSKPVIATDIPGPAEIVEDGVTGLIVPPAAPQRLAAAMERLLTDPAFSRELGANGRRRVEEVFNVERTIARIEDTYRTIAGAGDQPGRAAAEE